MFGAQGTPPQIQMPSGMALRTSESTAFALVVVVLVAGIEVAEAGRLLLARVVADVRVVVARGRAAVAGEDRGVLDDAVVLAGEAGAGAEDRLVAAGQVDGLGRGVRVGPHLHVVRAAQPVGRVVAALDEEGDEVAEEVVVAADRVGALRAAVRAAERDDQADARGDLVEGAVGVEVRVGGVVVAQDVVHDGAAHAVGDDPEGAALGVGQRAAVAAAVGAAVGGVDDLVGDLAGRLRLPVGPGAVVADDVVGRGEALGGRADEVVRAVDPVVPGRGAVGVGVGVGLLAVDEDQAGLGAGLPGDGEQRQGQDSRDREAATFHQSSLLSSARVLLSWCSRRPGASRGFTS